MGVQILQGDCRDVLKTLPDQSVNCCVTSPPYFGLRDYGTATWEGGDEECDHTIGAKDADNKAVFSERVTRGERSCCVKCGAKRVDSQIGLESTPDEFVSQLVSVFREVKRVLRDDGTLWLNLGDSYVGSANNGGSESKTMAGPQAATGKNLPSKRGEGLKPKDLIGIPWRVAFALQADGWYLRQDIIWHKPNPMPESVTDRCTKAHEYVFLLSKSAKYWYDAGAVKEPHTSTPTPRRDATTTRAYQNNAQNTGVAYGDKQRTTYGDDGRNKRSVWTVPTRPYKGAHFATFPPDLIRPCILAGCPVGGTVLDCFGGSGTTGEVSEEEGRNSILIELNPEYVELEKKRTAQMGLFCISKNTKKGANH